MSKSQSSVVYPPNLVPSVVFIRNNKCDYIDTLLWNALAESP